MADSQARSIIDIALQSAGVLDNQVVIGPGPSRVELAGPSGPWEKLDCEVAPARKADRLLSMEYRQQTQRQRRDNGILVLLA
ncbi:hypothetical protein ACPA9J_27700 [Pseudomonas aeruginosa]